MHVMYMYVITETTDKCAHVLYVAYAKNTYMYKYMYAHIDDCICKHWMQVHVPAFVFSASVSHENMNNKYEAFERNLGQVLFCPIWLWCCNTF